MHRRRFFSNTGTTSSHWYSNVILIDFTSLLVILLVVSTSTRFTTSTYSNVLLSHQPYARVASTDDRKECLNLAHQRNALKTSMDAWTSHLRWDALLVVSIHFFQRNAVLSVLMTVKRCPSMVHGTVTLPDLIHCTFGCTVVGLIELCKRVKIEE